MPTACSRHGASPCGCSFSAQPTRNSPFLAWVVDRACAAVHKSLLPRKQRLFARLRRELGVSRVAEVGLGSAPNLQLYGAEVDSIVGVDINAASQPYARKAAQAAGLPDGRLRLVLGRAEALPLPDESVDAVVATHVSWGAAQGGAWELHLIYTVTLVMDSRDLGTRSHLACLSRSCCVRLRTPRRALPSSSVF